MATLNFPTSPSLNDTYSFNGKTWVWNGLGWQLQSQGAINGIIIGNSTPAAGTFTALSATGNITGGNLNASGLSLSSNVVSAINSTSNITTTANVSSDYFLGNGAFLTGVITSVANINNGNSNVSIDAPGANVTVSVDGVSNVVVFADTGEYITGLLSASGNITSANLNAAGLSLSSNVVSALNSTSAITTTANVTGGNLNAAGLSLSSNVVSALNVTSNIAGGNINTVGNVFTPTIQQSGTYNPRINLGAGPGIVDIGGNGLNTQFLPGGQVRVPAVIFGGTFDGGQIDVVDTGGGVLLSGLRSDTVKIQTGTTGTAANTWVFTGNQLSAPGNVLTTSNILGSNVVATNSVSAVSVVASGNVTGNNVNVTHDVRANNAIFNTAAYANAQIVDRTQLATKFYVDNSVAAGINIHSPVVATTTGNLTATYTPGGTTPTWTDIVNNKTLVTASAHGLNINDQITFFVTTNGVVANLAYFVYDTPNATSITLSEIWVGPQITNLTNGTGLSITSRAKPGVGATLTNTGAQAALTLDGVALTLSDRVLVKDQTTTAQNGIYVVTDVGSGSSDWILTRSSDTNQFAPQSPTGLSAGDYVYVDGGLTEDGASYVQTTNAYIIIGTTGLTYTQFSGTVIYTGTSPITITGQTIALANTTGTGNTVVLSTSPSLVTPNLGAATGNSVSVTGNVTGGNLNAGSGAVSTTGNVVGGNVLYGAGQVSGTGNILTTANISGGNVLTGGEISATGNVIAGNIMGGANVNATTHTGTTVSVTGNVTGGNIVTSGAISTTANVVGGNIVTGGVVTTANINGATTLTITTGAGDINLWPTAGNIHLANTYINHVATPVQSGDAANKQYVDDAVSTGITIHTPVYVEAIAVLAATYTQGGTTHTVTDITGNTTLTFSATHSLNVNDQIYWGSTFNGITANTSYFVHSVPANTQITLAGVYSGPQITNLTNGTGLSQVGRANPGVGATLTANVNGAVVIDGVTLTTTQRVLVYQQPAGAENGVYVVTNTGNVSAPWVLTRSSDTNTYQPASINGLDAGDYFYIQAGTHAGQSYVLTAPTGEIIPGYDSLTFTQFAASVPYTAGNGLSLNGTTFSVNVDNDTTAISGGNVVVKTSANLITPNIGAATGSSLSVTGNINTSSAITAVGNVTGNYFLGNGALLTGITAASSYGDSNVAAYLPTYTGNLVSLTGPVTTTANITGGNVLTGGIISATGNITSIANISGGNVLSSALIQGVTLSASGNIDGGNIATAGTVTAIGNITTTANISGGNLITPGLISAVGNIVGGNLNAAGLSLSSNVVSALNSTSAITTTANITGGNIIAAGTGGNISGANVISGTTLSVTANITGGNLNAAGLSLSSNVVSELNVTGNIAGGNTNSLGLHALGNASRVRVSWFNDENAGYFYQGNTYGVNVTQNAYANASGTTIAANVAGAIVNVTDSTLTYGVFAGATPGATVVANTVFTVTASGNATATGNISGGNLVTAGAVSTTGNITGGNLITAAAVSAASVSASGNATGGNINTPGIFSGAGNVQAWSTTTPGLAVGGLHLGSASATANAGPAITFGARDATSGTVAQAGIYTNTDSGYGTKMYFATTDAYVSGSKVAASIDQLGVFYVNARNGTIAINNSGSNGVGNIGTATSVFNTVFAKATSAQYADLAEQYLADADYPPGTVLIFGGEQEVTADIVSHSTAIAGVVSENPSYLMNSGLQGQHVVSVALLGRVPCQVQGTIRKGDLLVASNSTGVAQRLDPAQYLPGCVIGKALANYSSAEVGTIEIAVGVK